MKKHHEHASMSIKIALLVILALVAGGVYWLFTV